jgi:hypothetical protein
MSKSTPDSDWQESETFQCDRPMSQIQSMLCPWVVDGESRFRDRKLIEGYGAWASNLQYSLFTLQRHEITP